jgi:hypothetical protein
MVILIKKDCPFCEDIKELVKDNKEITVLYVKDGMIEIDGQSIKLDEKITGLPALLTSKNLYIGKECVMEFLNTYLDRSL